MPLPIVRLGREWRIGPLIGAGGFGKVYEAEADGIRAAIKFIPKAPGADREMLFSNLGDARNVTPIIDSGEDETHWIIVMPRADMSLRRYLRGFGGPLPLEDALRVLLHCAQALTDLDGRVVHRDIKPENILLFGEEWCLSDFGISRYAEASTAPDTQRYALSPVYAGPERWRDERVDISTDIYSLGVVAHEMLGGSPPFAGKTREDFREQHLHANPPVLTSTSHAVSSMVAECMLKAPQARPRPANLLARLNAISVAPATPGFALLQAANRAEVARQAERTRRASEAKTAAERRSALFDAAKDLFGRMSAVLFDRIVESAPAARVGEAPLRTDGRGRVVSELTHVTGRAVELAGARLVLIGISETIRVPGPILPFDVIAHGSISVELPTAIPGSWRGFSHSLWFADPNGNGAYNWCELSFSNSDGRNKSPYAQLYPDEKHSYLGSFSAAFGVGPRGPVEPDSFFDPTSRPPSEVQRKLNGEVHALSSDVLDTFFDRWARHLAAASSGTLKRRIPAPRTEVEAPAKVLREPRWDT